MKLRWTEPGPVDHELIWGAVALVVLVGAALAPPDLILTRAGYRCPFRALTGLPCPSCGATRALAAATRLRLGGAFALNPLAAAGCVAAALFVPYAAVAVGLRRKRLRPVEVGPRAAPLLRLGAVLLIAANWAYLLATR